MLKSNTPPAQHSPKFARPSAAIARSLVAEIEAQGGKAIALAGDVRSEEYYFPRPANRSLLASLAPHHPIDSRWRWPDDAEQGWLQVREQVAAGTPVAVAVDNFEVPFRPAYQDVHSNHLVIVHGFDDERETVSVLDAIPPFFDGKLSIPTLTKARQVSDHLPPPTSDCRRRPLGRQVARQSGRPG